MPAAAVSVEVVPRVLIVSAASAALAAYVSFVMHANVAPAALDPGGPDADTGYVRRALVLAPLLLVLAAAPAAAAPVPGAPACTVFPNDNVWRSDVSKLPVHARSSAWLASASASSRRLHPDFGSSGDPAVPYGIPYHVVSSSHAKVNVAFDYDDESDPGPYPLGGDTPIEGGAGSGGDMHTVVVDKDTCTLYETWYTQQTASGWTAGSGAIWSLKSNAQRPAGWTSADAAGLPILPGLLRWDEVVAGTVDHAIRFTVSRTDRSYVWPARHHAGAANDPNLPPMGARFRLKASYDVSGFRGDTQVVLRAMKKHGLMLADNGSNWYFQGAATNSWPDAFVSELKQVPASAFEAVDASSLMVSPDSMAARGTGRAGRPATYRPPGTYKPFSPTVAPTRAAPRTPAVGPATSASRPAMPSTPSPAPSWGRVPGRGPDVPVVPDARETGAPVAAVPLRRSSGVGGAWVWVAVPVGALALVAARRLRRT